MVQEINGLPAELNKGMTWLSKKFTEILHDPAQDARDIYQDLWVVYLEKKHLEPKNVKSQKDFWFIIFRNTLIDKARKSRINKNRLELLKKELSHVDKG